MQFKRYYNTQHGLGKLKSKIVFRKAISSSHVNRHTLTQHEDGVEPKTVQALSKMRVHVTNTANSKMISVHATHLRGECNMSLGI